MAKMSSLLSLMTVAALFLSGARETCAQGTTTGPRGSAKPTGSASGDPVRTAALPESSDATAASDDVGEFDDLEIILTNWTTVGTAIESLSATFIRQEYDTALAVETRMTGRVHFESSGRGLYAVEPPANIARQKSDRTTSRNRPYQLNVAPAETFYWIQGQFLRINPVRREYELLEVPERFREVDASATADSWDIIWTRLGCVRRTVPGLVEPDLAALHARFDWSLLTYDEQQIILTGTPKSDGEKRNYSQIHLTLDAETYFLKSLRTIDPAGSREVVHTFSNMQVNAPRTASTPDWAPELIRLRLLTAPPLAPPSSDE
jgi:hypothetical protein